MSHVSLLQAKMLVKDIVQSTPWPCAVNTLTVSLSANVPLATANVHCTPSITISGLGDACVITETVTLDGADAAIFNSVGTFDGVAECDPVASGRVGGAGAVDAPGVDGVGFADGEEDHCREVCGGGVGQAVVIVSGLKFRYNCRFTRLTYRKSNGVLKAYLSMLRACWGVYRPRYSSLIFFNSWRFEIPANRITALIVLRIALLIWRRACESTM